MSDYKENSNILIREGTIEDCIYISGKIPEFKDNYAKEKYEKRFTDSFHSILIAEINGTTAGFKTGYERENYFYSWLGGVLPSYRNLGVAKKLAVVQETKALENGYIEIRFKTYHKYKAMLIFGLKNGFEIIELNKETGAIWLRKFLKPDA